MRRPLTLFCGLDCLAICNSSVEPARSPDYRLTCFFVDKRYRRKGLVSYDRPQGMKHCVMSKAVPPS
jgi:hypothetical protein